jgi:hypothetical protein
VGKEIIAQPDQGSDEAFRGNHARCHGDAAPHGAQRVGEGEPVAVDPHPHPQSGTAAPAARGGPAGAPTPAGGSRPGLASQHHPSAALVGLELIQRGLLLPPLGVQRRQVPRRVALPVQQRGDQPVGPGAGPSRIVQGGGDHPHRVAPGGPLPGRVPAAQARPVRQGTLDRKDPAAVEGIRHSRSAPVAANARHGSAPGNSRSGEHQHPRAGRPHQPSGQRDLPTRQPSSSASTTAWVPHSASATMRSCGNAPPLSPRWVPGRPNAWSLAAVSATS